MNLRVLLPVLCFVGLIVGFLIMLSPFFVTGGIVCWFDDLPQDAWLNHLLGSVMSIVLGLAVMLGSGVLAVIFGIVFGVEATQRMRSAAATNPQQPAADVIGPEPATSDQQSTSR